MPLFQKTKDDAGASPHLVELKGKRLGFYSEGETSDNMEINFKTLKRITGEKMTSNADIRSKI